MSELDSILRTVAEVHGIDLSSAYGSAGPIGQTALPPQHANRRQTKSILLFFERV